MVYVPENVEQVETVAVNLARQIRQQYTIAYAPLNQALDGTFRSIRVSATGGEHYTVLLGATAKAMGIEEVPTAPWAPWQNAFVERFIGSARRECFDHVIRVQPSRSAPVDDPLLFVP